MSPPQMTPPRHITAPNDRHTPHHHRQRPLHAMSPPTTAADKSQRLPLPSSRDVGAEIGGVGVRRSEGDKKWSEEAGEWGRRRQGKRRGKEEAWPPPSLFFHSLFRTGAALAAPFLCFSNGGSIRCPHVFSFRFEQGQRLLPPCLFISFRTGAASAAPVSFLFFSNGGSTCCPRVFSFCFEQGGSVNPTRCPHFSQFRSGAACIPTLPPFLSVSNGGSVYRTRRPLFLSVSTRDSVKLTRRPRFVRLATSTLRGVLHMVTVYTLLWSCCYNKHQAESETGEHLSRTGRNEAGFVEVPNV
jgi:hypothetical protein